ncbi:MAG: CvpA family protein [Butyrivibrio sp.]|nr:CvpA family protein [Butyrivibrio sp.]
MSFDIAAIVISVVVVCLFLWRISYGAKNGLIAEAAGLIAVTAAFAAVYYIMKIAGSVASGYLGNIIPKIGYLVIAFVIYRVMTAVGKALRDVKDIPILGGLDRLLGAVLGAAEAYFIVYTVDYITDLKLMSSFIATCRYLFVYLKDLYGA